VGRMFLLNFTLYDQHAAERDSPDFAVGKELTEHCWAGEQMSRMRRPP
jgi:hypothetical protein